MIRQVGINAPDIQGLSGLKWHKVECELVTPMYGGGVESTVVDEKMPIRVSSIRGQLRFWWRLLAEHKWKLGTAKEIREAEFDLWGGMGDADGSKASKVFIRVEQPYYPDGSRLENKIERWASYEPSHKGKDVLVPKGWANAPYALFPAQGRTKENPQEEPHALLREGLRWTLNLAFSSLLQHSTIQQEQVFEVLRWWASFGGMGSRVSRGLGAVRISNSDFEDLTKTVTQQEVQQAGFQLILREHQSADANKQMIEGVGKLADFRQKPTIGRNEGQQKNRPGRSRWPEPDAERRIFKNWSSQHEPEHKAGNMFPRALFGLPIVTKFNGKGEPNNEKPFEITLAEDGCDRLPSPVIIRPYHAGVKDGVAQWKAAALILPYKHLLKLNVSVDGRGAYPIWQDKSADLIKPIKDNNGTDPIQAFANYFAK